jgi:hypothetical protein
MSANVDNGLVISYLTLRKAIGFLGLLWPFVLALGAMFLFQTELQDSISAYYYTQMSGVFVGTLWAIGFFLFSYNGYDNEPIAKDWILSRIAWVCALGTSLFPAHKDPVDKGIVGYLHFVFAASLFLVLIYFCLALFRKDDGHPTPQKLWRNTFYKTFGFVMVACIALIAVYYRLPGEAAERIAPYKPVFWLESLAIVSFGASWLIKGEFLLKDKGAGEDQGMARVKMQRA